MTIIFSKNSWKDYTSWLTIDKKKLKRINELINNIRINPFSGIGKPEPLKYELSGYWSRRIDDEHRLVYKVYDDNIIIYSYRYQYE